MFEREVNPYNITEAEIVVGIPSNHEANSIIAPTQMADQGLIKYFPYKKAVIVNCDNHSSDGTPEVFLNLPTEVPKIYISTEPGIKGKGNNFRNLFRKIEELGAHAAIVIDAGITSTSPDLIFYLGQPLFQNFDFVSPIYVRHKYEGAITNSIAYPLTRALYGRRVRYPLGGECGFSRRVNRLYLKAELWNEAVADFGIDIWMSTLAINHSVPVSQAFLGRLNRQRPRDSDMDSGIFRQVVGTIFTIMANYESDWLNVRWSKPTAVWGLNSGKDRSAQPVPVAINTQALLEEFEAGFETYPEVWNAIFPRSVVSKLYETRDSAQLRLDFPTSLWAKVLFDMSVSFRDQVIERNLMLDSLLPIYCGKIFSFIEKARRMSVKQTEEFIESECLIFEELRPYLNKHWKGV
jgi:glucosylglycerate synthase